MIRKWYKLLISVWYGAIFESLSCIHPVQSYSKINLRVYIASFRYWTHDFGGDFIVISGRKLRRHIEFISDG